MEEIAFRHPYYHHFLTAARPRHSQLYKYDQTQHGRFFVREYNSADSDVEADYSVVHFVLDMLPLPDRDVYLDGDFTNRRLDDSSVMRYDPRRGSTTAKCSLSREHTTSSTLPCQRSGEPRGFPALRVQ